MLWDSLFTFFYAFGMLNGLTFALLYMLKYDLTSKAHLNIFMCISKLLRGLRCLPKQYVNFSDTCVHSNENYCAECTTSFI